MFKAAIEKEAYAFDLLNQLSDDYGLTAESSGDIARLIWRAGEVELDNINRSLQDHLLLAMQRSVESSCFPFHGEAVL